ncbi:MAG: translocation/assembly module TamB domain-containing protein [Caulobacterales bacterium]
MRVRRLAILGAGAAALVGGFAWALGPGAASLVDALADGQRVWRLGVLDVSGVSGARLSDLRIARLALRDADGVWIEARNAHLSWRPFELIRGRIDIAAVEAEAIAVLRRPTLAAPQPSSNPPDLRIGSIKIGRVDFAPGVAQAKSTSLRLSASTAIQADELQSLSIDLAGLDGATDALQVRFARAPNLTAHVRVDGPAGGALAGLAGGAVKASLDAADQKADAVVEIDGAKALSGAALWTAAGWSGDVRADLLAIPALSGLADRFGGDWTISASGDRVGPTPAAVKIDVQSARLRGAATGRIDASLAPVGPIRLAIDADAHVLSLRGGRVRSSGALAVSRTESRYQGRLNFDAAHVIGAHVSAEGPIDVRRNSQGVRVRARLDDATVDGADIADRLLAGADAEIDLSTARADGTITLNALTIASKLATVRGQGRIDDGKPLKGTWTLADLRAVVPGWGGRGAGSWRFAPADDPRLDVAGRVEKLSGLPTPLDQLVGRAADIDAALTFAEVVEVKSARLSGRDLRAGFRGEIDGDALDLAMEASARGPIRLGGVEVAGAADVTGRIGGAFDAWSVKASAMLATLEVAGAPLRDAIVRVDLAPEGEAHVGPVALTARYLGAPVTIGADAVFNASGVALSAIDARLAEMRATGRLNFSDAGPDGVFILAGKADGIALGASGAVSGAARFAPADWALDLALRDGGLGPDVAFTAARLSIVGDYLTPRMSADVRGMIGEAAPFRLSAAGPLDLRDGLQASANLEGALGGQVVASRRPVVFALRRDGARLDAAATIGAGDVEIRLDAGPGAYTLDAVAREAPLSAFAAGGERLDGSLSGRLAARGRGATLTGEANAEVRGFRLARRAREPIDASLALQLRDGRLSGEATAKSAAGLSARATGAVPVVATAAPLRIARVSGGVGEASWTLDGPIDGVWGVFGPIDQSLTGRVAGEGAIRLSGDRIAGSGALKLIGARFEDKPTGLVLRDLTADIGFDESGAVLRALSARDTDGGKLSGSGRLGSGEAGEMVVYLDDMRVLDRPDAKAQADGRVTLAWTGAGMKVSGDVDIMSAELTPPQLSAPAPPVIDVVEINRPGGAPRPRASAQRRSMPIALDLRIRAPRRIFTRGRGAEAEWALDVRATGSPEAMRLFGEARLLRGQVNLAGRPFALSDGVVTFRGDPLDADVALTAEANATDLTATIKISGRLADPQIDVSSSPALPEDEILPQILFGANAQDLSPLQAAQLAASLATLAGRGSFDIADAARRAVDLDRLALREDASGVLVTGGKYITRDVYVEVSRGALGAASTSVEWQIKPRLFLVSSFLGNGDQRVAVRWRRSY